MQKHFVAPFDNDVTLNGGYLYTTHAILSSKLANERLTQATLNMTKLTDKKVIDIGCGDGTYTYEFYKRCHPKQIIGVDSSKNAIKLAQILYKDHKKIQFHSRNIYHLESDFKNFDIAIVRGVIHHLEYPEKAIQSIAKVAKKVIILEPNGYNPLLKIVEKVSLYHRIHKEKSYTPRTLRRWLKEAGFIVEKDTYVGFVPFFCPDGMAIAFKKIEILIEHTLLFSRLFCAVYVVLVKKKFS
ncbi:class I SAM-dependent methyltransferase [Candidatus Roizmanbacteria bacterium]|nr:class I SAM-dependent methyltransferase [Candidatus Roizmanbacteria bacterium]